MKTCTSWGGTSKDTVRRSTLLYLSIAGRTKNKPGKNINEVKVKQ